MWWACGLTGSILRRFPDDDADGSRHGFRRQQRFHKQQRAAAAGSPVLQFPGGWVGFEKNARRGPHNYSVGDELVGLGTADCITGGCRLEGERPGVFSFA